jgi:plasmid maintenance system antidote protein VapI
MTMHNPPHPGEFITEIYLEPHGISGRELATRLAEPVPFVWTDFPLR